MVSIAGGPWKRCTEVFPDATPRVKAFEEARYVRSHPTACRLLLVKREAKRRHRRTRMGKHSRSRASTRAARRGRGPWLLACSPGWTQLSPEVIVTLYSRRMRIEQSFRDLKNERLGLGFSSARSRAGRRLEILLLIAHLASWVMRMIGECAQQCQMQGFSRVCPASSTRKSPCLPWPAGSLTPARRGFIAYAPVARLKYSANKPGSPAMWHKFEGKLQGLIPVCGFCPLVRPS